MARQEFVLISDVDDAAATRVTDFAKANGFRVFRARNAVKPDVLQRIHDRMATGQLPEPTWDDEGLAQIILPDAMSVSHDFKRVIGRLLEASKVTTAADLTHMTFQEFMRPDLGFDNGRRLYRAKVMEFMIENGLSFSDLNPAAAFPTRLEYLGDELDMRAITCLMRDGLMWLEIMPYYTEADLLDIRNIGQKTVDTLKKIMSAPARNLSFKRS